jgi:hypothetical protein
MKFTAFNKTPRPNSTILEVVISAKDYTDAKTWVQNHMDMSCEWVINETESL